MYLLGDNTVTALRGVSLDLTQRLRGEVEIRIANFG